MAYSEEVSLSLQLVLPDRAKLDEVLMTMQPENQATRLRGGFYTIDYREVVFSTQKLLPHLYDVLTLCSDGRGSVPNVQSGNLG